MRREDEEVRAVLSSLRDSTAYRLRQIEHQMGAFASKADPGHLDRLRAIAIGHYYSGSWDTALPPLNALVSQERTYDNVSKLGWTQLRVGTADEAARTAKHLVKMDDDNPVGYELLAAAQLAEGDAKRALNSANKSLAKGGSLRAKKVLEVATALTGDKAGRASELAEAGAFLFTKEALGFDINERLIGAGMFRAEMTGIQALLPQV